MVLDAPTRAIVHSLLCEKRVEPLDEGSDSLRFVRYAPEELQSFRKFQLPFIDTLRSALTLKYKLRQAFKLIMVARQDSTKIFEVDVME